MRARVNPVSKELLLEGLRDSMHDAERVDDAEGFLMLSDIIEGFIGGWVSDEHARAALFASERRIRARLTEGGEPR